MAEGQVVCKVDKCNTGYGRKTDGSCDGEYVFGCVTTSPLCYCDNCGNTTRLA